MVLPPDYGFQIALAAAWAAGYVGWAYLYYRALDPPIRARVGAALGVRVVWTYDARHYFQQGRYKWWRWGVADVPADRVVFTESIAHVLGLVIVTLLAGGWPIALVYLAMVRQWVGPLTLYACVLLAVPIFSIYWSGRYQPIGVAPPRQ